MCQMQRETDVSMPVELPYRLNAQSSRRTGNGPLGWTIRAFALDYLRILATAVALRLPGLCAHKRCFAIQLTSPPLAASFSTNMQFPVLFFRSCSGGCHPERVAIQGAGHLRK